MKGTTVITRGFEAWKVTGKKTWEAKNLFFHIKAVYFKKRLSLLSLTLNLSRLYKMYPIEIPATCLNIST